MFIFRLFFGLIGLGFSLLLLPLKLLQLPLAVILVPFRITFHWITHHLFIVILLVLALLIWSQFRDHKSNLPELAPVPAAPVGPTAGQPVPVVQPVLKKEDGDSNFASDLYASMNEQERAQYSKNFYWAMTNLPDGQVHTWNYYNINGAIRGGAIFTNGEGVQCRRFTEILKVHTVEQTLTGSVCQEAAGAWCKLKPNATAACNLGGSSGGFFDSITSSLKNLF